MRLLTNPSFLAGAALDVLGLGLVIWSLPEGGTPLAAGVVCLLAGAALITRASSKEGVEPSSASSDSDWKLDPALRQPLPRQVSLKPLGYVMAACWLLALVSLGWFAAARVVGLNPPVPSQSLVETEGLSIPAEIHEKIERTNAQGEPRFYLYYSYELEGAEIRSSLAVTPSLYRRYQVNDVVQLKVLPSEPPAVVVPEMTRDPFALRGLILGGVVAALLLVFLDSRRRFQQDLVRNGLPVSGVVSGLRRRGASGRYRTHYRVGGSDYSVIGTERNPRRRNGDQVTVLHDPEKPSEAVVYEGSLYRADPR